MFSPPKIVFYFILAINSKENKRTCKGIVSTSFGWQESSECEQHPPHLSILVHVGIYKTLGSPTGAILTVWSSGIHGADFGTIAASIITIIQN